METTLHFSSFEEKDASFWKRIHSYKKECLFLVIEQKAHDLFLPLLQKQLRGIKKIVLPSCQENLKSLASYEKVTISMLEQGIGRDGCLIAIGGGSLLDMAGFTASTYARGIDLVFIPTTLLAMVDACLGGKTALNIFGTKNMIGTFYPATDILIATEFLSPLPKEQMESGVAEVIKYGLIADPSLIDILETGKELFFLKDPSFLQMIISKSLQIKKNITTQDPTEKGLRRSLNFGHTLGHALEAFWQYTIPHGHAIAVGMALESYLSPLKETDLARIFSICKSYNLFPPTSLPSYEDLLPFLQRDKKNSSGQIRCTFLSSVGTVDPSEGSYCSLLSEESIRRSLSWYKEQYEKTHHLSK
jgi:3-dehydroquinate synthase